MMRRTGRGFVVPGPALTSTYLAKGTALADSYPTSPGVTFKDIPGYPGYCVGDDGSVWSSRKKRAWFPLTHNVHKEGHRYVALYGPKHSLTFGVHRLVLMVFVGPCPSGMVARHFPDRDPANNRLSNLQWGTHQENVDDKAVHGTQIRGSANPLSKLTEAAAVEIKRLCDSGVSINDAAARFGVHPSRVSCILSGRSWSHAFDAPPSNPPGKNYRRTVPDSVVVEILRLRAEGGRVNEMAARFSLHSSTVSRIVSGQRRKYLTAENGIKNNG